MVVPTAKILPCASVSLKWPVEELLPCKKTQHNSAAAKTLVCSHRGRNGF